MVHLRVCLRHFLDFTAERLSTDQREDSETTCPETEANEELHNEPDADSETSENDPESHENETPKIPRLVSEHVRLTCGKKAKEFDYVTPDTVELLGFSFTHPLH